MIISCAFVPVCNVVETLVLLVASNVIPEETKDISTILRIRTLIDVRTKNDNGCRNPQYKVEDWCMYDSVVGGTPRTNYAVGWHTSFALWLV